jgi:NAD+ synthase
MKSENIIQKIVDWLKDYAHTNNIKTFIVGISGGIDSSLVSTLCALTGINTIAITIPIEQKKNLDDISLKHGNWLISSFKNAKLERIDLTQTYKQFVDNLSTDSMQNLSNLSKANLKSRLRMCALYSVASNNEGIVVGTGNKVEDFGIGFFTKYGDGGVDISPIADLMKTEVWECASKLGILQEIIDAPPTDGLWEDGRTDEEQIGMSYKLLEWVMENKDSDDKLNAEQLKAKNIYRKLNKQNQHKMLPIPICKFQ